MEIKNLQTFLCIADCGSFSKAAELLGYTQPTISFQIRQLEEELDCRLFDRIGKHIQLTEKGKMLVLHALRVRDSLQNLQESFHNEDILTGRVVMYSADSICEKMMLLNYHNFYRQYPGIKLEFQTGATLDLLKVLDRNEADIIFTLDSHIYRPEYIIKKESPVPLHFVTAADHPLAERRELTVRELTEYPFVLTEKGMSYRKILDTFLEENSIEIDPALETGRTDILVKCLIDGYSIGFLPDFVTEPGVSEGSLVRLHVKDFEPTIWKQLIVHRDKWISKPLQAFIDFVCEHEFAW